MQASENNKAPGLIRGLGVWAVVLVITVAALFSAIRSSASLVSFLLLGYAGVTQFFPGVVLGLFSKRVTMRGLFAGLLTGIVLAVFLMLSHRDPFHDVNAGFICAVR